MSNSASESLGHLSDISRPLNSRSQSTLSLKSISNKLQYDTDEKKVPTLKLFESPLAHERRSSQVEEIPKTPSPVTISGPLGFTTRKSYAGTNVESIYNDRSKDVNEYLPKEFQEPNIIETPEFRRYKESTNIELFYDLFFIANLTTFTDVLDINSTRNLKSYAGFFSILWFLWLQVSLFDVRFVTDSIIERVFKAAQFGVMIGLAAVGPRFNPEDQAQKTFRSLAIILMLSRAVLALQYGSVLYHVWYYKNSKGPVALLMGSNIFAAFVYFLTFL